jgi:hypothetical protein
LVFDWGYFVVNFADRITPERQIRVTSNSEAETVILGIAIMARMPVAIQFLAVDARQAR